MTPQPPLDGASSDQPHLRVISQYIKELTFRNAMAAAASQAFDQPPSIEIGVEIRTRPIGDTGEAAEVDLIIGATAQRADMPMFSIDLTYSGLFQFVNVRPEDIEPMCWIECPRLLFPFSRQILADITREGSYPPLLINPIDFAPLYWAELRDRERRGAAPGPHAATPLA